MSIQMFVAMAVQVAYFVTDMKFVSMLGNEVAAASLPRAISGSSCSR
jgi:hypothetical protein